MSVFDRAEEASIDRVKSAVAWLVVVVAVGSQFVGIRSPEPVAQAQDQGRPVPHSLETDKVALKAIYDANGGGNWKYTKNWDFTKPLDSTWHGVTVTNGRVTKLDLSGIHPSDLNNLTGALPGEIGHLTALVELDLASNNLTGPLPPALGNLSNLESLLLSYNVNVGRIPAELGNLTRLGEFRMKFNELTGEIPPELGNLQNLRVLDLSANNLSGEIPAELGNLANLSILNLSYNDLSGTIPAEIGNIPDLSTLDVAANNLTGRIPDWLRDAPNLYWLVLRSNGFTGGIPDWLGDLSNLHTLDLQFNELDGEIPMSLGNLTELGKLDLGYNNLVGEIPPVLGKLSELQFLSLARNKLEGPIPSELGDLTHLWALELNDNRLTGPIPSELANLRGLDRLALGWNRLTGPVPPELGNLSNLVYLEMGRNNLYGRIPPQLMRLPKLKRFSVIYTRLCLPASDINLANWYELIPDKSPRIVPDCVPPGRPTILNADARSDWFTVTLSWDWLDDLTVMKWQTRWKTDGDFGQWFDMPNSDAYTREYRITGLTEATEHTIELRAVNFTGEGQTARITATPLANPYDVDGDGLIDVASLEQLNAIRWDLNGDASADNITDATKFAEAFDYPARDRICPVGYCTGYELTADLTFDTNGDGEVDAIDEFWDEGMGWDPIGSADAPFTGRLNGNGFSIHGLHVDRSQVDVGLFGRLKGTIENTILESVEIVGHANTGGLVGTNEGIIVDSHVKGRVTGRVGTGGLVGRNSSDGSITNASANAIVVGRVYSGGLVGSNAGMVSSGYADGPVTGNMTTGGLTGFNSSGAIVERSYASGDINGRYYVGGLIGLNSGGSTRVTNSYSTGDVSGEIGVGGLIGSNQIGAAITNGYSVGNVTGNSGLGGLVGRFGFVGGSVEDSYWDVDLSGHLTSYGGSGEGTIELRYPTAPFGIYFTWDSEVWDFGTPNQFPALKADWDGDGTPTVSEFGNQR